MAISTTLLLTRPISQARSFAKEVEARLGCKTPTVFSPVMTIEPRKLGHLAQRYKSVIVTSMNGAAASPSLTGRRVYCVGLQTARHVSAGGGTVVHTANDADALIAYLEHQRPLSPLLHVRGEHARGNIAKRLTQAGLETDEVIAYEQIPQDVSPEALSLIVGVHPAILPLFSPRSASLTGRAAQGLGAGLHVIALSQAVALAWADETGGACEVCVQPDGAEMLDRVIAAIGSSHA